MATPTLGTFLRRLKQAMSAEALASCSDQELVEQFRSGRGDAVFRAILERHGPMVLQVCRRVLSSPTDVEDAFQATFLILIRRGHTVRRHSSLASWLHGVAWRSALKLRTQSDRRRRREARTAEASPTAVTDDTTWGELRGILDEELRRLPETFRAPLVLCYLEGRTQDEAATRLDVSKSTVRRNLERARELLGRRLVRRGVTLSAVLSARLISDCAQGAGVPRTLLVRTVESASHTAVNVAAPASVISARVAALSDGVIKAMHYTKCKTIFAVMACSLALGIGVFQFSPEFAAAQDKSSTSVQSRAGVPDIEPIDPNLVFDPEVQKQLRLSQNQVRQLTEARDKGTESTTGQAKRVSEIDERIKKLQEEIDRLNQDRYAAEQVIHKAQTDQVKTAIPKVLSSGAVQKLREMTLQRMSLSDVLLDAKVRARLDLNDEQVKKIQELASKERFTWLLADTQPQHVRHAISRLVLAEETKTALFFTNDLSKSSRSELLKVLTPQQREALEKLSGVALEKSK
ncbi:MAG TPA: RNA polymerase sigma factor [Gemmataceae bacterium]|nr:RNA polymerase sigma factor [Gemmataceae bacterium]